MIFRRYKMNPRARLKLAEDTLQSLRRKAEEAEGVLRTAIDAYYRQRDEVEKLREELATKSPQVPVVEPEASQAPPAPLPESPPPAPPVSEPEVSVAPSSPSPDAPPAAPVDQPHGEPTAPSPSDDQAANAPQAPADAPTKPARRRG